ncbi:hypothetical protein V1523DRAFT_411326 [Lipomyces doorenjongii]
MVKKDTKSPALHKTCRTGTGLPRLQAASSSQGSEGTVSSVTSSAIFKRILARQGENSRQEPESEEVFDVVSVASDTPSAISISSAESSQVATSKERTMGPKGKGSTSTKRRNGTRTKGGRMITGKGKVPLEYLEMVHEVVGAHSTPYDDDNHHGTASASSKLRRRTKRHQSADKIQSLETEGTPSKRFKPETSWDGKGKGKDKVIDLDSDSSMLEVKTRSPTPAVENLLKGLGVSEAEDSGKKAHSNKPTDEDEDDDEEAEYASSEESEWEAVDMGAGIVSAPGSNPDSKVLAEEPNAIEFTLGETGPAKPTRKKSTITREDKEIRITVHTLHLLSLLCHGSIRSRWCSDGSVKSTLAKYVPQAIEDELHPDPSLPIPQRTRKFLDGLRHLMDFWNKRYRIIYRGLCRRQWDEIGDMAREKNREPPMDLPDFRRALGQSEGSRDLGAQGFCALLRAFHVRTRLVFSMQPLPFSFASKGLSKPSRASKAVLAENENDDNESCDQQMSSSPAKRPPVRLRKPRFSSSKMSYTMADYDTVKIEEAPYPVIWVEAWDEAGMQWVSVDPMVLKLVEIAKSKSKFEPPASESANVLSYVIAFDSTGHAKDVTRRYAQFYNAKTRKLRMTNEPIWQIWFDRVMRLFQSEYLTDIDQMEDAALLKKEASEELPNNIQDFKGHPIFVLERHLRQNEVIYPKVPCGAISAGRSKSNETEPIYRRRDVKLLRSAMQWYKIGRQVKIGEQPLKHGKKRSLPKSRSGMVSDEDDGIEEDEEIALYADFQTELYVPPPVINGKVPRNDYGNLDVFVPSMVPKGAVHLRFRGIGSAAKLCGIDYVDAVGGFDFQHRKATARLDGIVVAEEYVEAVVAVYNAQQEQLQFDEDARRQEEALKRWRKYLIALRVRERVAQNPAFRQMEDLDLDSVSVEHEERDQEQGGGSSEEYRDGGFVSRQTVNSPGEFVPDGAYEQCGFVPDDDQGKVGGFLVDADEGCGFIADDNDEGGFVADHDEGQADAFF